jgi:hypothetical protein
MFKRALLVFLLIASSATAAVWTNESGTMQSSWKVGGPAGHACVLSGGTLTDNDLCSSDGTYINCTTATSTFEPAITAGTTGQYWRGDKSWQTLNSTAVGLGSVENTALSTWAGTTNITTLGTVTTCTYHGGVIGALYGGTGIANDAGHTITISGASGGAGTGYTLGVTLTGNTSVTFPTSGTLSTTPAFGTLTNGDLCTTNGTTVACTTATSTFAPAFGTLTNTDLCTTNGTTVACTTATSTFAPAFGTLTSGDYCTTNGTTVACTVGKTGTVSTGVVLDNSPTIITPTITTSGTISANGPALLFNDTYSNAGTRNWGIWSSGNSIDYGYLGIYQSATKGGSVSSVTPVFVFSAATTDFNAVDPKFNFNDANGNTGARNWSLWADGNGMGWYGGFGIYVSSTQGGSTSATNPVFMIDRNGYVGIGNVNPGASYLLTMEASGGGYYNASDHAWHTGSSIRWKTNVQDMTDGLTTMNCLRPRTYTFDEAHGGQNSIGFIAEEAATCIPTLVDPDSKAPGYYNGINYGNITAVIVQAIREQDAQYTSMLNAFNGALNNYNSVFVMPESVSSDNSTPRTGMINGGLQLNPGNQIKPDCTDELRGTHWFTRDAGNQDDVEEVCVYFQGVLGWRKITWN